MLPLSSPLELPLAPPGVPHVAGASTPRDTVLRDGAAALYRFRSERATRGAVLLVPSLINRWYVLDLHPEASLAAALVAAGFDTYCLDWGYAGDEDRHLEWDELVQRLTRMARAARRLAGSAPAVLGYCIGGTLSAIHAALHPGEVAALVNLAGPIDFAHAGKLGHLCDRRWFDAAAVAEAGNVHPLQMQSGFVALRPTLQLAKLVRAVDRAHDPEARAQNDRLERWASDNVPFPAAAYARYISALYQQNELCLGRHHVAGRQVDLGAISCPLLVVVTDRDEICPPPSASALVALSGSRHAEVLTIAGGHVGAVVGKRAPVELHRPLVRWLNLQLKG